MKRKAILFGILLAAAAVSAMADTGDPPSRVARLNYLNGSVAFRPGSVEEWAAATLNYPLTTADHLWTDPGAQAEMHIGSTAIRMAQQTALAFLNLDDQAAQLSLTDGTLEITVRSLDSGALFEIDTPNVAISLAQPGTYRIEVDSDRYLTVVTTRDGEADIAGGGDRFTLHAGQTARVSGENGEGREMDAARPPDDFERWCEARDRAAEQSASARYVGTDMTGYEDLDSYGAWSDDTEYGPVWAPRTVPVDWAPYRFGHWAWIDPWGWTWIDDQPWGFAPFHYGRWVMRAGVWIWAPGPRMGRPVYSPALVVFVGGSQFGGIWGSGGGAAWFPLGPREPYRPPFRASERYIQRVNIVRGGALDLRVTDIRYVNRTQVAVTVVSHDVFVGARPVNRGFMRIQDRDLVRAEVMGGGAPIAPRRESVLAGPQRGGPPNRFASRAVVVRTAPPPPPVAFQAQQRELERNQGRPLDAGARENLRPRSEGRNPMVRSVLRSSDPGRGPGTPNRDAWRPAGREAFQQAPAVQAPRNNTPPSDPRPVRGFERPSMPAGEPRNAESPRNQDWAPRNDSAPRNQDGPRGFGMPGNRGNARPADTPRIDPPRRGDAPQPPRAEPARPSQPARNAEPARAPEPRRAEPRAERPPRPDRMEKREERKEK